MPQLASPQFNHNDAVQKWSETRIFTNWHECFESIELGEDFACAYGSVNRLASDILARADQSCPRYGIRYTLDMSVKEQVLKAIQRLPEDIDFRDVTDEIALLAA